MSHNVASEMCALETWAYPVEKPLALIRESWQLDAAGLPTQLDGSACHPETIALYALEQWQYHLAHQDETFGQTFLALAGWFVQHETPINQVNSDNNPVVSTASGWPIPIPGLPPAQHNICLSARTQGTALSVLLRAYQLTNDERLLALARRVVHTFELDILDGGIASPVGQDSIFFEAVATYPAAHQLSDFLLALFGLYDYLRVEADPCITNLLQRSLETLHKLFAEFDTGFWTRESLSGRELSTPTQLTQQIQLLEKLANLSSCTQCTTIVRRWRGYQQQPISQLRVRWANYLLTSRKGLQRIFFPARVPGEQSNVCIAVPAFPVTGGIYTFLKKVTQIMGETWQYEYVTQHLGPDPQGYVIHRFGTRRMTPWYFPFVWLYVLAGWKKLLSLSHQRGSYDLILAQDAVYTGAMAGLAGKITGARVVCVDHSDLSLLIPHNTREYRAQRLNEITTKNWPWPIRGIAQGLLFFYWPCRVLLARLSAHTSDYYLSPGVPEDGVNTVCLRLGIPWSRLTRIQSPIEIKQHVIPDDQTRSEQRASYGLDPASKVIAIVCRLAPEKGLEIAIAALDQALQLLPESAQANVHVLIAGAGPLRQKLEADIRRHSLDTFCTFCGEVTQDEVITILGISDIFLYTSTRGACYALAVLEAMASGCAVIASTEPPANASLLAEGRGIAIPPGNKEQTAIALVQLLNNPELARQMGQLARQHIAREHNPAQFQRSLLRATGWRGQYQLLTDKREERKEQ